MLPAAPHPSQYCDVVYMPELLFDVRHKHAYMAVQMSSEILGSLVQEQRLILAWARAERQRCNRHADFVAARVRDLIDRGEC